MASVGSVVLTVLAGVLATLAVVLLSLTAFLYLLYRDDLRSRRGASGPWAEQEVVRPRSGKLRFAFFYWGSRGDFQPLAVLAQQLKREGHSVIINVRERYREAGRSLGLEESELFAQEEDHTEDVVTVQLQGKSGPQGVYHLFRHVAEHTPAYLRQFDEMVTRSKADVIIVNEFALNVGILAADKHRLPLFVLRYTPLFTSTTAWLSPMVGTGDKGSFLNWLSYTLPSFIRLFLEGPVLRRLRREQGLRPRPALSYFFGRRFWQYPAIQAYSSTLVPVPHKDIPPWYFNPGPLLPPSQEETEAVPAALSDFLRQSGEQPIIYIGFGSFSLLQFLPLAQARQAAHAMLGAVQELGIRAILLEHTFDFMLEEPLLQNPQWYMGKRFPHSWLFPRVSVIVHQGGAGHCAASARSGRPTVVIPIFEEQEFNGQALVSAGIAVRLRIQDLTQESFKKAFQDALRLEGQARVVGAQLDEQVRHSGEKAVKEILEWLGVSRAEPQGDSLGARKSS